MPTPGEREATYTSQSPRLLCHSAPLTMFVRACAGASGHGYCTFEEARVVGRRGGKGRCVADPELAVVAVAVLQLHALAVGVICASQARRGETRHVQECAHVCSEAPGCCPQGSRPSLSTVSAHPVSAHCCVLVPSRPAPEQRSLQAWSGAGGHTVLGIPRRERQAR